MQASEFTTTIVFDDGTKVSLGGDNELYVEQTDDSTKSCVLNDERLALIKAFQKAEEDIVDG